MDRSGGRNGTVLAYGRMGGVWNWSDCFGRAGANLSGGEKLGGLARSRRLDWGGSHGNFGGGTGGVFFPRRPWVGVVEGDEVSASLRTDHVRGTDFFRRPLSSACRWTGGGMGGRLDGMGKVGALGGFAQRVEVGRAFLMGLILGRMVWDKGSLAGAVGLHAGLVAGLRWAEQAWPTVPQSVSGWWGPSLDAGPLPFCLLLVVTLILWGRPIRAHLD